MVAQQSILELLKIRQKMMGSAISVPGAQSRVAFVFPTKDRLQSTKQTLATLDTEKGFDLIWVDGSETPESKALPDQYKFHNIRLLEVHKDVEGRVYACSLGLERLFELGYDYLGLIENELAFEPGWFRRLSQLFQIGADEGLAVGAVTVRSYNRRVIEYGPNYTINWNIGGGMVLYSRAAYQLIRNINIYSMTSARRIRRFYAKTLGIDLGEAIFCGRVDRILGPDWGYEIVLYQNGLAALGSIPSLAHDLILDVRRDLEDSYVEQNAAGRGLARSKITWSELQWMRLTDPFFLLGWAVLRKSPRLYWFLERIMARRYQRKLSKLAPDIHSL